MTVRTPIEARSRGVPAWALGITVFVLLVGGVYFAGNLSGENPPIVVEASPSGGPSVAQQAQQIIAAAVPACTSCHAEDLTGNVGPTLHGIANGPQSENLQALAEEYPDEWIQLWIAGTGPEVEGIDRQGMPAYGDQLTDEQISVLVEYLRTLE